MINSYLKTAIRSIGRKKTFTILNVAGLSIGIAAALTIALIIRYEYSYDTYHSKADRIYRVTTDVSNRTNGEVSKRVVYVPLHLPEAMQQEVPGIEKTAIMSRLGSAQIYVPQPGNGMELRFKQSNIFFTGPTLYRIFDYTWVTGNPEGLSAPNTVVLSESVASAYFQHPENALGRTVQLWSYRIPLRVVGVFKDLPSNTDIPLKVGIAYNTLKGLVPADFNNNDLWNTAESSSRCYVLLRPGARISAVNGALPGFVSNHFKKNIQEDVQLHLQPLKDIHLNTLYQNFTPLTLSPKALLALGLIGIFLLLVACINFINLATALSVNRAKEIGVRKVLGSNRWQLFAQFLAETSVITFFSLLIAVVITIVVLPFAGQLVNRQLSMELLNSPFVWIGCIICGVVVTVLSGSYPGMVVSGFNPVMAIKSRISIKSAGGASLRRGLVVFQFVVAQLLVIGTLVVVKQMRYIQQQSLGYDRKTQVLINLPSDSTMKLQYTYLKASMQQIPGVQAVSLCTDAPSSDFFNTKDFYYDVNPVKQPFKVLFKYADADYYKTFGITLKAGRMLYPSDTIKEVVVNETLVKKLGLKRTEDIIGKTISVGQFSRLSVVGVINDFNNRSLHDAITPLVIGTDWSSYEYIALKLSPNNMPSTLKAVQQNFTQIYPNYLYDLSFVDELVQGYYDADVITSKLFKLFAGIAVFISCLGLYGLISFMISSRIREVGIRKVLGASANSIVYLFSREFIVLIMVAFIIAAPLGYYFMQSWLEGFYYHTGIDIGTFIIAIFLSILIAWITVGYKTMKAALANPVKHLKEN